ncbi:MAG: MGMT family protein [Spirochaetaceae bacterium]|nr:MGMT family protein [Spirochaetaceae bacterium]
MTAKPAITLWFREIDGAWYGLAESGERLAATATGASREEAARILEACLPPGIPRAAGEGPSSFADGTARMLAAIESGDESGKRFELATEILREPAATVYRFVAAIPLGYVSSYGRVAVAAGTIAREVGRLMMNNPLYPIVPCHRVVGADFSLVGYRGATSGPDLDSKLARLRTEACGFRAELELAAAGGLVVFPAERVLEKTAREDRDAGQLALF